MSKIETRIFQALIFLIPSNLAYHWILDKSYISGVLVDYLIPKLYLTDIFIWCLVLILLLKNRKKIGIENLKTKFSKNRFFFAFLISYFAFLFLKSVTSENPLASLWFLFKLVQMGLLVGYIWSSFTQKRFLDALQTPLSLALIFQSLIGFYQIIYQKSLAGYLLLGESTLRTGTNLSRGIIDGALKILPYGTTPHPNVLAGFGTFGLVSLLLCIQKNPKLTPKNILSLTAIGLTLSILLLTQSLTGIYALIVGIAVIATPFSIIRRMNILLISHIFVINLLLVVIPIAFVLRSPQLSANPSIVRRYELIELGKQAFKDHPFTGTGLNLSIPVLAKYGRIYANTAFFQPIHNIYLLWFIETGFLGLIGALVIAYRLYNRQKPSAPLVALLIIGLLDHYPLTLQTGQILLAISLSLPLLSTKK